MQRPHRATLGTLLLGGLVLAVAAVLAVPALRNASSSGSAATRTPVRVLVISGGGLSEDTVVRAGAAIGWHAQAVVHQGSGISRAPAGRLPLAAAVRDDRLDPGVGMIVVQGGEYDGAATPRELDVATYHLLDYLIAHRPAGAILVLTGPIPQAGASSAGLVRIDHAMRLAARQRQVRYIDALELRWSTTRDLAVELGGQLVAARAPRTFGQPLKQVPPKPSSASPTPR